MADDEFVVGRDLGVLLIDLGDEVECVGDIGKCRRPAAAGPDAPVLDVVDRHAAAGEVCGVEAHRVEPDVRLPTATVDQHDQRDGVDGVSAGRQVEVTVVLRRIGLTAGRVAILLDGELTGGRGGCEAGWSDARRLADDTAVQILTPSERHHCCHHGQR